MAKGRPQDAAEAPTSPTPARGGADEVPGPRSPMDDFPDEERSRRWPRLLGLVAAGVVVLAGLYVGGAWAAQDRVPPGTTVAGVEIGGRTADEAAALLEDRLATVSTDPVPVAAGEKRTSLDPAAAGLELDVPATVAQVTGFGLEPARLWRQVFGGDVVDPVTRVDEDALDAALGTVADSLQTPPVDGTLAFVDGAPEGTDAVEGTSVDEDAAAQLLVDEWLTAARPVELPTVVAEPEITSEEVDRAVVDLARPLADAPVTVAVAEQIAEIPADVLTSLATFAPEDGDLELRLDGEGLVEAVVARTRDLLTNPADASFAFENGAPVIVPGEPGTTLDPEALAEAVAEAGTGEDRTARVELVEVDPEQSTAELEALGVTTKVSEFSTPLTADADRNHNLTVGANRVDGRLVRPDEVFSLTDALGPITTESGYRQSGVVVNGVLTKGTGGGLSQMGTTVYNAAFFAGMEDVEHQPHSYYFSRYPAGREATIYEGVLDVKFRNTTPYGVLLQSWVADGRLHVAMWSTPYWTVEEWTSGRSNVVHPTTVHNTSSECIAQSAGSPGFSVTVGRRLLLEGEVKDEQTWTWRYKPQNAIVCGPPPAPAEPAPPATPPAG